MKPKVTLKIEEADDGAKPEVVADAILEGTGVPFYDLITSNEGFVHRCQKWRLSYHVRFHRECIPCILRGFDTTEQLPR